MMPRLGEKYKDIEIEITSKPITEYNTDEYFELELPVAPAVMVGEEILVEGSNISQDRVETSICRHLGLPIAPAIIFGDELLGQGRDIDEEKLEAAVCRHIGLPEPGCWGGSRQDVGCLFSTDLLNIWAKVTGEK